MRILIFTIILLFTGTSVFSQSNRTKSKRRFKAEQRVEQVKKIREIIDSKNFVFKAETVNPINTKTKTLLSDFGIEVRNDSVFSYLPYYGSTYVEDYSSHKNSPMGFMQPVDEYSKRNTKSGYRINITLKNENEFIGLNFFIAKTGYTSLSATFLNRQSVSYEGEIVIPLPKK